MPRRPPDDQGPPPRSTASGFVLVPPDATGDPIRRALAAIDRVHATPNAPPIPIRRGALAAGDDGHYDPRRGEIVIAPDAPAPESTVVHEFGHFLDHRACGGVGPLGRILLGSEHSPDFVAWRAAVDVSQAVRNLYRVVATVPNPIATDHARYLLRTRELWARAYVRFIATRSADPTLLAQIDAVRSRPRTAGATRFDYYWAAADFAPIAAEIDEILLAKGWTP